MEERLFCKQDVASSNLASSTNIYGDSTLLDRDMQQKLVDKLVYEFKNALYGMTHTSSGRSKMISVLTILEDAIDAIRHKSLSLLDKLEHK